MGKVKHRAVGREGGRGYGCFPVMVNLVASNPGWVDVQYCLQCMSQGSYEANTVKPLPSDRMVIGCTSDVSSAGLRIIAVCMVSFEQVPYSANDLASTALCNARASEVTTPSFFGCYRFPRAPREVRPHCRPPSPPLARALIQIPAAADHR